MGTGQSPQTKNYLAHSVSPNKADTETEQKQPLVCLDSSGEEEASVSALTFY